jgi:hypothetical protein
LRLGLPCSAGALTLAPTTGSGAGTACVADGDAACGAFDASWTASHSPPDATINIIIAIGSVHTRCFEAGGVVDVGDVVF